LANCNEASSVLRVLARTDVSNERVTIGSVEARTTSKSGDSFPFMMM